MVKSPLPNITPISCKRPINLLIIAIITSLIILVFLADCAFTKSYSLDHIKIYAEILSDGSLKIEESRTYSFRGRFSWADFRLPLNNVGRVKNFTLREGSRIYAVGTNKEPGSYQIELNEQELYVKWFYKARNETRTFTLGYTVTDVATIYDDIAEFYYKFVGETNRKQIAEVDVHIQLPRFADSTQVKIWAHGPVWGSVHFEEGHLRMLVSPLPAYRYWEVRVLFPPEWLPASRNRKSGAMLSSIMAEEAEWARIANEKRAQELQSLQEKKVREKKAWPFAVVVLFVGLFGWGLLYLKYGKGLQVPYRNKIDSTIPDDLHPTLASYLYYQRQVVGNTVMATLLNLAQQGHIKIEQLPNEAKRGRTSKKDKFILKLNRSQAKDRLLDFEMDLLSFFFKDLAEGQDQIEFAVFKKNRTKVRKWFGKWKKLIKGHFEGQPFWEKQSVRGTVISTLLSALVIISSIVIVVKLGPAGSLGILGGAICFGLSFAILRFTPEMKLIRKKLQALQRYLKKYHFASDNAQSFLNQIQAYLIYGVALGVGTKAIKKMLAMLPADQQSVYFPWYVSYTASATPGDFAQAISSFVSVANSTLSSTTGAGGGASVGGGAGAGGAAGGAG